MFRHRLVSREDACKARPARSHCDNAISYRQSFLRLAIAESRTLRSTYRIGAVLASFSKVVGPA